MAGYPADKYPIGISPRGGQPSYGNSYSSSQDYPPHGGRGFDPGTQDRLPRTISTANLKDSIDQCRDVMMRDLVTKPPRGGITFLTSTPQYTLTLPSINNNPEFRKFVYDLLTDKPMEKHLVEDGKVLNWCNTVSEVLPLNTLRDGNCLLHAASLGMWGFQDRDVALRGALSTALRDVTENTLYQRWQYNRESENKKVGLELEPHQWNEEWQAMVRQASSHVQIGRNYDSLDDFHIFVLANVLRRPIILYAASKIHSMQSGGTLQEINFQGVYLPLLWESATCMKNPLPLAYDGGHFCALAVPESAKRYQDGQFLLPLVDYYGKQLAIKFTLPVEDSTSLVMDYLKPIQIGHGGSAYITTTHIVCAMLDAVRRPAYLNALVSSFTDTCWNAYNASRKVGGGGGGAAPQGAERTSSGEKTKCINSCGRYGDAEHAFMCMECHRKATEHELQVDRSPPHQNSREQPGKWAEAGQNLPPPPRKDPPPPAQGGGASSGTVKCPQCAEPGMPQLLGMCQRCYGNSTGGGKSNSDVIYERLPSETAAQGPGGGNGGEPPAVPLPRNAKDTSLCRKPGCKFFGSFENRFYCSQCFNKDMENILKEVDEGPPIRPDTPHSPAHDEPGYQARGEFYQPPLSPPPAGAEPPKCYQCKNFFANEEYMGLCNDCFMKSTVNGGPPPRNPSDPGLRRQDGAERFYNSTAPKLYNPNYGEPAGPQGPSRGPGRVPINPTAPVTTIESEMADLAMRDRCFMCTGGQLGSSSVFTVCRKHAQNLFELIQKQGGKEEVRRDSEAQHKPSYRKQYEDRQPDPWYDPPSPSSKPRAYEVPRPFGNEVRSKPYFRGNDLDDPQHQNVSPGMSHSVSEHDRVDRRGANVAPQSPGGYDSYRDDRRWHGNDQGYPPRQPPAEQHREYGNERGWSQDFDRPSPDRRDTGRGWHQPGGDFGQPPPDGRDFRRGGDFNQPPPGRRDSERGRRDSERGRDFNQPPLGRADSGRGGDFNQPPPGRRDSERGRRDSERGRDFNQLSLGRANSGRGGDFNQPPPGRRDFEQGRDFNQPPLPGQGGSPPGRRDSNATRYGNELDYPPPSHHQGGNMDGQGQWQSNDFGPGRDANSQQQGAGPGAGAVGGGGGGATGTSPKPRVKALCAKTGCSFKGYERLKGLCPDCYIDEYQKYPDFYSPDEFPLV